MAPVVSSSRGPRSLGQKRASQLAIRHRRAACCAQQGRVKADPDYQLTRKIFSGSKYVSLDRAEKDIAEYCKRQKGEDTRKCWDTLNKLEQQHKAAMDALNTEEAAKAEADLERLDALARELSACGGTKRMVDALYHLQSKIEYYGRGTGGAGGASMEEEDELRRQIDEKTALERQRIKRLRQVFDRMDSDQDGKINISEFRAAMDDIGDHLDGPMVAEICHVMDIHGAMGFDQFKDIVDAETIRSHTEEATRFRVLLHDRSDSHFKDWLSAWN